MIPNDWFDLIVPAAGGPAEDPLARAAAQAERLMATAARLVALDAERLLDEPAALLAVDLARGHAAPPDVDGTRAAAAGAYVAALAQASTAVYYCRRVQHAAGRCWFPGGGVCGRVLAVAHAVGQRADQTGAPR